MPWIVPFIPLIAGGVTSGTQLGMGLAGVGQPSPGEAAAAQQKQMQADQLKQLQADQLAKQKMIQANLSNAQEQGGGALSGPGLTDLAAIIAGLPGESGTASGKGALASFLGTGSPVPGAATGAGPDTMVGATYGLSGGMG